jgi:TonB family protein
MNAWAAELGRFWLGVATHLWQTTLVLVPLFILAAGMRRAPARWLYALWALAFVKVLVPLAWCSGLATHLARTLGRGWFTEGQPGAVLLGAAAAVLNPIGDLSATGWRWGRGLTAALLALTAVWALRAALALWRLGREARASRRDEGIPYPALPPADRLRLAAALATTAIPPACLRVTADRHLPRVTGIMRPVILVPRFLLRALGEEELCAILLHEEAHRRRRDPLRTALQRLSGAVLGLYPLLGATGRRLQQTSELVCDEFVLRSGVSGSTYAHALARTLRLGLAPAEPALAAGVGSASLLHARFERLSNPGRFSGMTVHRLILATAVGLVAAASFLPLSFANPGTAPAASGAESPADPPLAADLVPPKILAEAQVAPVYPEAERKAGAEGTVHLEVVVKADGSVGRIVSKQEVAGHAAFTTSATTAVRQWRFEPGTRDGKPVDCTVVIPVAFRLSAK